jgi:D-arabinose 1-dehydrogenase-like Zn-dependent alcohol dehydrogenase
MLAAVFVSDAEPLLIEDVKRTEPRPRDVVVELGASGICGADLSLQSPKMSNARRCEHPQQGRRFR